jgi:sterol desaturase/sphingolipid hydroxylase (fatty acid hydroxylase superfamily)
LTITEMLAISLRLAAAFLPLLEYLLWIAFSCIAAEVAGYWVHRLLHSEKIAFLSRNHMIHHIQLYGPMQPMRPEAQYRGTTDDRPSLGDIGLEWLVPAVSVLGVFEAVFWWMGVSPLYQVTFVIVALSWARLMLNYLHNWMHVQDFWMEKNPLLRKWFLAARRLHDIHHHQLDDRGKMNRNFGIGFYILDRIFGTFSLKHHAFNPTGLEAAKRRHEVLYSRQPKVDTTVSPSA